MSGDLAITLEGRSGAISAASLYTALGSAIQLLKEAGTVLGSPAGQWNIAEMRTGSAVLVLDNPAAPGAAALVMTGLRSLGDRPAIPVQWNQTMVRKARDLARLAGSGGVSGVSVASRGKERLSLTTQLTANAEQAVQARDVSLGSVRGLVDKWDQRRAPQIGLTLSDGETVVASYPRSLSDRVLREALGHEVEARGEIHRNGEGQRVRMVINDFTVVSPAPQRGIDDLAGLYRELGDTGVTALDVLAHRE